jgi:hypothetical protein
MSRKRQAVVATDLKSLAIGTKVRVNTRSTKTATIISAAISTDRPKIRLPVLGSAHREEKCHSRTSIRTVTTENFMSETPSSI